MSLDLENFDEVRIKGEEIYSNLKEIYCPYFKDKIYFNSEGIEHLKFKRQRQARPRQDQYMRLKLIHLAPIILGKTSTLQGIWETKNFEKVRSHNRTDNILKEVIYYEFIAVIENIRVKIIIKQIDVSRKIFWSIIPYWRIDKNTNKRNLHSGFPEVD